LNSWLKDGVLIAKNSIKATFFVSIQSNAVLARASLKRTAQQRRRENVDLALRLLGKASENPPGDTSGVAGEIVDILVASGIDAKIHPSKAEIHNVVARVRGNGNAGARLILNGHLDTFPLGNPSDWTFSSTGVECDGRLYGLGISDMKGGLAASIFALRNLAAHSESWPGEVVATFAGDEETMGVLGTQFLLDTVPEARGDAVICADAGSPRVLRIGEKGLLWVRITATGRAAHAAHVHRGDSAIDKLIVALNGIAGLRGSPLAIRDDVRSVIEQARSVSEPLSGDGESEVLQNVTVTFGTIHGGRLPNLVSDNAVATADIRLPLGYTADDAKHAVNALVAGMEGISIDFLGAYDPSWTNPHHPLVRSLRNACLEILDTDPVVNMRVGASDARLYRRAGIPTVVCGLTPHNMGAADEFVEVDELCSLGVMITMAAYDYLHGEAIS
jgi:succinyl-diaminopimelate desuccinylase